MGMARRVGLKIDACLYFASALLAVAIAQTTELQTFRAWAGFAAPGYLVAAVGATIAIVSIRLWTERAVTGLRLGMTAIAFIAAVIIPLAYEVNASAEGNVRLEQAEVVAIEKASTSLMSGHDPYATTFYERGLESRPQAQHHFAYMPAILIFGLPRALIGPGQFTDARVVMAFVTLAALATALAFSEMTPAHRLRLAQVAAVLPSGSIFIATSGDDLSVLALMLLGIVMLHRESRLGWPVLVAAALLKQTAWPVVLVLLVSLFLDRAEPGQRLIGKRIGLLLTAALSVSAPFLIWQPGSFVSGLILFPLGLTSGPSFDQPPTLGSWILGIGGIAGNHALRDVLIVAMLSGVLAGGVSALLYVSRIAAMDLPLQACFAGLLMLALIIVSPISRPGYLVYPVGLLMFGLLTRGAGLSIGPTRAEQIPLRRTA
jgi:hypothetical protein